MTWRFHEVFSEFHFWTFFQAGFVKWFMNGVKVDRFVPKLKKLCIMHPCKPDLSRGLLSHQLNLDLTVSLQFHEFFLVIATQFEKSNFCPKIQWVFHPNFFWQLFSWNQSCQQLKSLKLQHFHEFLTTKNRQFSREIKVEFLDYKWIFGTVCVRTT